MNLTVFGATGRTGIEVVKQALAAGNNVTAYVRSPEKLTVADERLTVIQGEMNEPEKIRQAIADADAVISALGPTSNKPVKTVSEGMKNIIAGMQAEGVKRLVASTGAGVPDPNDTPKFSNRFFGLALRLFAKNVLIDSQAMVDAIRNSDIEWTLVRGPRLTDNPGTGVVKAGYAGQGPGTQLSRADFAAFMLAQIDSDEWLRKMPMISN